MTFAEFFHDFWWLMFPIFGMMMAAMGMFQDDARATQREPLRHARVAARLGVGEFGIRV